MSPRLKFDAITVGDILRDFRQTEQRVVHYLVIGRRCGIVDVVGHGTTFDYYFILRPIDSSTGEEVHLCEMELNREFSTWRRA